MSYILRLFENDKEVSTLTVQKFDGADYPKFGRTIDSKWTVVGVISHSDAEHSVRVEHIKR